MFSKPLRGQLQVTFALLLHQPNARDASAGRFTITHGCLQWCAEMPESTALQRPTACTPSQSYASMRELRAVGRREYYLHSSLEMFPNTCCCAQWCIGKPSNVTFQRTTAILQRTASWPKESIQRQLAASFALAFLLFILCSTLRKFRNLLRNCLIR